MMYFLYVIIVLSYWVIYENWLGGCLLASLLFVLFLSIVLVEREKRKMKIEITLPRRIITEGEMMEFQVSVKGIRLNNARRFTISYEMFAALYGQKQKLETKFLWGSHESATVSTQWEARGCDYISIRIKEIRWKDLTGLYSVHKKLEVNEALLVMPKLYPLTTMEDIEDRKYLEEQGFEYDGLRPYVEGDRLSRIHWKLYASKGEFFVRKNEEENQLPLQILVNLNGIAKEQYQDYFSIFYSVSHFLLRTGNEQEIIFGNSTYHLTRENQYEELFTQIYHEDLQRFPAAGREVLAIDMNQEGEDVADFIYQMELTR